MDRNAYRMVTLSGGERGVDRLVRALFWKSL